MILRKLIFENLKLRFIFSLYIVKKNSLQTLNYFKKQDKPDTGQTL